MGGNGELNIKYNHSMQLKLMNVHAAIIEFSPKIKMNKETYQENS